MSLPDDVWSTGVFPYLDYQSTLRCSEVSRHFLQNVIPAVKQLVIERPEDMHAIPARKFTGVETIDVRCFTSSQRILSDRVMETHYSLSHETSERLVPFLGCFPRTKHVYLCGRGSRPSVGSNPSSFSIRLAGLFWQCDTEGKFELLYCLILSLCAAYRAGTVPPYMKVHGLFHQDDCLDELQQYLHTDEELHARQAPYYDPHDLGCRFCTSVCSSIPVEQACRLKCAMNQGQEFEDLEFSDIPGHCLCLTPGKKVDMICAREGGEEAYRNLFNGLYLKEELDIYSVWAVSRYFYCDEDGYPNIDGGWYCALFVAELHKLVELRVLIDNYGFPSPQHSEEHFIERLFCVAGPEECLNRSRDKCFMTKSTYEALCGLGLPLSPAFIIVVDDIDNERLVVDDVDRGKEAYHEFGQTFTDEDLTNLRRRFRKRPIG